MKKSLLILSALLLAVTLNSHVYASDKHARHHHKHHHKHHDKHHHGHDREIYGRVVAVEPIVIMTRIPLNKRSCWNEPVQRGAHDHAAPGIIMGGIIGGVVGNHIGEHHHNAEAATLMGTLIGAAVGHDMASHNGGRSSTVRERHCQEYTDYEEREEISGYRVTYLYEGDTYVTRTPRHPGTRIRISIDGYY